MKKFLIVGLVLAATPATAVARTPTHRHVGVYYYLRRHVDAKFGHRTAGRNIVRDGLSNGRRVTDAAVQASSAVMERMLLPPVPSVVGSISTASTGPSMSAGAPGPQSGLEQCIISHESGGNPQAVNGQYEGIGQWSPAAWAEFGGTRYASSPLGATYAQQEQVLRSEGTSNMISQQGVYDGCARRTAL